MGAGRCLQRLRCDLRQGPCEGGGLLGLHPPQVLRRSDQRSGPIGRKDWLFVGRRAALLYSLAASCRLCGIDPFACLRDILTRISTHPAGRIEELLPRN
ncbi:MAG: transposase domain-containing protein [Planctomycetes bacterium]|nr:transposase domain-containing protein [Planctomycetota bacterium]